MKRDIFIGGAWPYANNSLHVGHIAALLPGDVLARYFRAKGDNVVYVSGTDCHGTPITVRAAKDGVSPYDIASKYHGEFVRNFSDLNFSYDYYSATFFEQHKDRVKEYFLDLLKNGYIEERNELQDYCEKCGKFLSDRELIGVCPNCGRETRGDQCDECAATFSVSDLKAKKCAACGSDTVQKYNKHLYFLLSKFQTHIREISEKNGDKWRNNARRETEKYLDLGLIDRAATRQLHWGVDVPVEGYEDKKIYVWIEAVLGYLTAGEKVASERGIEFAEMMKSGNLTSYFVHGKDNIPFHTIIFPALLGGIDGAYNMPDYIVSSEYVNMRGEKMSKSKGNLLSADELLERYGVDSVRFYLTAFGPERKDINFTEEDFKQAHNKYLVGVLGNFVNRNLAFIQNKQEGIFRGAEVDAEVAAKTRETYEEAGKLIEKAELRAAVNTVFEYANFANKYYDAKTPWVLFKNDKAEFDKVAYSCLYIIANLSNLIQPFLPNAAAKIKEMIGIEQKTSWDIVALKDDIKIEKTELLFQRL